MSKNPFSFRKDKTLPIVVVDNEYITVQYLPDKKIICHTVHQPIDSELFKETLDAGGEVLKQNGACKWLSDDRKNGPLSPEMINGPKIWGPGMIAAGWKYWALIVPEEVIAANTLVPVVRTLFELGLRLAVFSNLEEAFKWLEEIKD